MGVKFVEDNRSAPWYVWAAVASIIVIAVMASGRSERANTKEETTQQITPEMRLMAKSMVENYQENGVISSVSESQAVVSGDWYALSFENKKNVASALKVHFDAKHYRFIDLHTGKTVAEYGEILGFRVH